MGKSQDADIVDTLAVDLAVRRVRRGFPVMTNIWWSRPDVIRVIVAMGND
jgi:hypothetical protein